MGVRSVWHDGAPGAAADSIVTALNLSHVFGSGDTQSRVLTDITLVVPPGQLVIMTGPSGSGKTTLLTLLGALRSGQSGQLLVLGREVTGLDEGGLIELRRNIGFIFQLHNLLDSLTAIENVVMAGQLHRGLADPRGRAAYLLDRLGLGHRLHYKPSSLSGGQRQRVAVARALVNAPRLILADEPTAALDIKSSHEVVGLLQEHVANHASACIMVTHDNRILDRADRIVSLVDGRIVSDVMVGEQILICEMLSKIEFFADLDATELSQVAQKMQRRTFAADDILIRQGDIGDLFFLLRAGEVDVHVASSSGSQVVATLQSGRYFGERALITGDVRNATIVGRGDGVTYTLDKGSFQDAMSATPSLQDQLRKNFFGRQ